MSDICVFSVIVEVLATEVMSWQGSWAFIKGGGA